ncbi:MAG: bifunctional UDP-4-amino-4-deoxy-L-arabinose formyltransferase/UDP-glucuronic acid oxidase ArnA [Desulfobacula sp.]|jgi:UDP-4-amino-4-deoxy-L-arabinose formyltransferase/UDP-glucuronic acid dehydrogenase (UDP-4-keto-hexauronic acid decarboxylating)|nr:bifunctional UDP-4-amino-4-deoxy-L-arabinose formyltransferase/UDP-glucuronic acid oxidase ArnA [Desulfobacula sp.]
MKTIVFAYHDIGCIGIKTLLKNNFNIAAVFTHVDNPDENIWFESVASLCAQKNIPVYAPEDVNHPMWKEKIKGIAPDIIFSFYYRKLLGEEILAIPRHGCLNLHGSRLPAYRGRCPINWVLVNGETRTGMSLHYMTIKPDAGDIVAQADIDISDNDTAYTLHKKFAGALPELLDNVLPLIQENTHPRIPQDSSLSSYFGGRGSKDGEINWNVAPSAVRNLVRAVTKPYPGAFSFAGNRKIIFWDVSVSEDSVDAEPGTIVSSSPFIIACTKGAIQVNSGQIESGIHLTGSQLAQDLQLIRGMKFGPRASLKIETSRKKHILILGVNGFIGNALSERLLKSNRYEVHGMDIHSNEIERLIGRPGFNFHEGDISIHREWIEYHVKKCDIILPLVAIATPAEYTRNPLKVFELDFEENLRIVRYCSKYGKRILFPSTSEVYGMSDDETFDEDNSKLVLGPIRKQRWIYSCSKQLLDRVIYAYGQTTGLEFTIFRPFNWIGPRLDSLSSARIGSSRAITQLILNLVEGTPIQLVDGGAQKRCFTDVNDGVECLYRIIEDKNNCCNHKIINIGNPDNEASIKELARILVEKFEKHPLRQKFPPFAGICEIESKSFYGKGYEDVQHRKPKIKNAKEFLDWEPCVQMEQSIEETLDFFLRQAVGDEKLD